MTIATLGARVITVTAMSALGHDRSFGDVGPMSGFPERGHAWAIYELHALRNAIDSRDLSFAACTIQIRKFCGFEFSICRAFASRVA